MTSHQHQIGILYSASYLVIDRCKFVFTGTGTEIQHSSALQTLFSSKPQMVMKRFNRLFLIAEH